MTSKLRFDHVVIAVNDLTRAMASYASIGFTVLPGGRHSHAPTHNALVVFADGTYLELLGWTAETSDDRWFRTLQQHGEGIVDFALGPDALAQTLALTKARGLVYSGPLRGSRETSSGDKVEWQSGRPASAALPFFCEDITPRALRVPNGDMCLHPNGTLGISKITVATRNAGSALIDYRALLEDAAPIVRFKESRTFDNTGLMAACVSIRSIQIVLTSPVDGSDLPAASRLRHLLDTRGEGPFQLALGIAAGHAERSYGHEATHGLVLDLIPHFR